MYWREIILARLSLWCAELGLTRPSQGLNRAAARFEAWQLEDELPPDLSDLSRRLPEIHERLDQTVPLLEDPWDVPEEPETDLRWPSTVLLILVGILIAALWPGW